MAPLEIDRSAVGEFWRRFTVTHDHYRDAAFVEAFQFGDDRAAADHLIELVVSGPKRATAETVAGLEARGGKLPASGDLWVACDGGGLPRAVLESVDVRVGPLSSVDAQFGWDEGEGDRTRADWLRMHTACFERGYARLGLEMHADIEVIFECFRVP